jgi:hypothetical protein
MPPRPLVPVLRVVLALALAAPVAGCGRRDHHGETREPVTLEELDALRDTTGLSNGGPIVKRFEPYRLGNGLIRARGELALPEGTVLQLALYRPGDRWPVARTQFTLERGRFDAPPMLGPRGPLPVGEYRFELVTFFDAQWQPAEVLRATHDGRDLRGPGITRDGQGRAAFSHTEAHRL